MLILSPYVATVLVLKDAASYPLGCTVGSDRHYCAPPCIPQINQVQSWGQRVHIILGNVNNRPGKVRLARRNDSHPSSYCTRTAMEMLSGISRGWEQKPKRITREPTETETEEINFIKL